jgi:hypothetical protein
MHLQAENFNKKFFFVGVLDVIVMASSCRKGKKTLIYLCGFLTPPVEGADLRAALVASCLRGAFPPVDFLAVCLVRAMLLLNRF